MSAVAATLRESFNSNTFSDRWNNWGGAQCVIQDGQLRITTLTTAAYDGVDSYQTINLTGSSVSIRLVNAGNQALESFECVPLQLSLDGNNKIYFNVYQSELSGFKTVAGVNSQVGTPIAPYNSGTHKYFRISESAGTIYWHVSPDRSTWTEVCTLVNPFAITALTLTIVAGTWQNEGSTGTAIFDDLNYISSDKPGNIGRFTSSGNGISTNGSRAF